jgi:hypothetical protein
VLQHKVRLEVVTVQLLCVGLRRAFHTAGASRRGGWCTVFAKRVLHKPPKPAPRALMVWCLWVLPPLRPISAESCGSCCCVCSCCASSSCHVCHLFSHTHCFNLLVNACNAGCRGSGCCPCKCYAASWPTTSCCTCCSPAMICPYTTT